MGTHRAVKYDFPRVIATRFSSILYSKVSNGDFLCVANAYKLILQDVGLNFRASTSTIPASSRALSASSKFVLNDCRIYITAFCNPYTIH